MSFLLDTNIVSHLMRHPLGPVAIHLERVATSRRVVTSIVVTAEIRFGVEKVGSIRNRAALERFLATIPVEPWSVPADQHYGSIRARLEREGRSIGANDLFIAAHALAIGATLVTDNVREFERVPGLVVENWLRPHPLPPR